MDTVRELVLFIREISGQKPSHSLLKVYMLGTVLAVLGLFFGLLDLMFQPFTSDDPELNSLMSRQEKLELSEILLRNSANQIHTS